MNASPVQHIIDLISASLADASASSALREEACYGWRMLCWIPEDTLTVQQQDELIRCIPAFMQSLGPAAARFNDDGTALNVLICQNTFPAKVHRDTVMWLCAHALLEYGSTVLSQSGSVFVTEEFTDPAQWPEKRIDARDLSDWWNDASPIDSQAARQHRLKLQTYLKRRQFSMLGGYITRALRTGAEINRTCFSFVPLTIEAVWNQHPDIALEEITASLSLYEMSRKPRESLLSWIGTLPPLLREHPTLSDAEPIERVIESIRADCALPYSQANLSRSLGLTPAYFCRLFHDKAGMHFSTFLTNTRMQKAKDLLAGDESLSLHDLSTACGYPNKSYFCQVFKKHTGMTPGEYEQMMKKERP